MARIPELKQKRDARIKKRYQELSEKKFKGQQLYKQQAVLAMLEEEFFLSARTIQLILLGLG